MSTIFLVNAYFILESLEDDKTTIAIGKTINSLIDKENTLFYYIKIRNKVEFISALHKIRNAENIYPLIHIAAHGDREGIQLLEGNISWVEFTEEVYQINLRAKNNVMIIMALCYGALVAKAFDKFKRAPFFSMLGPINKIKWNFLDECLFRLYKVFIPTNNLELALIDLKSFNSGEAPLLWFNSVGQYQKMVEQLKRKISKGQLRHDMIASYKRLIGKEADFKFKNYILDPQMQKKLVAEAIQIHKKHWFMIDLYPENEERFAKLSFEVSDL